MLLEIQEKFHNPLITVKGEKRATVLLKKLKTLWINTGSLCNLSCEGCYIESSPRNDRYSFICWNDIKSHIAVAKEWNTSLIGVTGGEPFINPNIEEIISEILGNNFELLILTNALKIRPDQLRFLDDANRKYPGKIGVRVSLDHHTGEVHERIRGPNTFMKTLKMMKKMAAQGITLSVAGRMLNNEVQALQKYDDLFKKEGLHIPLSKIVLFPEMREKEDVPEISELCFDKVGIDPDSLMCASERMIVKKKGETECSVLPCTLLVYDERFNLGTKIKKNRVSLNHPYCAQFCVLGGASCSSTK